MGFRDMIVSVVIPALNEEKLLPDCLRSLNEQDYRGEYEIIVADNGSTDNTADIARKFNASVVPCAEKKGVAHARQLGADAARGSILIQADADTVYPADWLSKIVSRFDSHPKAVAVAGRFLYSTPPYWAIVEYIFRSYVNWLTAFLFGVPLFVSGATFAFRRDVFQKVHGYRGLGYAADQYGMAVRLRRMGRIIYDSRIYVLTSSRSVTKPLILIIRDIFVNIGRWLVYILGGSAVVSRPASAKARQKRFSYPLFLIIIFFISLIAYGFLLPASPVSGFVGCSPVCDERIINPPAPVETI